MNIQHLEEAIVFAENNIKTEFFDISKFRKNVERGGVLKKADWTNHICNTTGCMVGYLTGMVEPEGLPRNSTGDINFGKWSKYYFDLEQIEWNFLFSSYWGHCQTQTIQLEQSIIRMKIFVESGIPDGWGGCENDYEHIFEA